MKFWKFDIERQENTRWDYIIPWGLAFIELIPLTIIFAQGYYEEVTVGGLPASEYIIPSTNDWFLYSVEIISLFLLMAFATIYLKREHRFVVFPLSSIISFLIAPRSIHTSMIGGLDYAIGSIIIYTYYKQVENPWKDVGIYWGEFGIFYGLIIPFIISFEGFPGSYLVQYTWLFVILYIVAFVAYAPFLTFVILPSRDLESINMWFVYYAFINTILWFIIFALIGMGIAKFKTTPKVSPQND